MLPAERKRRKNKDGGRQGSGEEGGGIEEGWVSLVPNSAIVTLAWAIFRMAALPVAPTAHVAGV